MHGSLSFAHALYNDIRKRDIDSEKTGQCLICEQTRKHVLQKLVYWKVWSIHVESSNHESTKVKQKEKCFNAFDSVISIEK